MTELFLRLMPGYGTYVVGGIMILHGLFGYILGDDPHGSGQEILNGAGIAFLRRAISTSVVGAP